MLERTRDNEIHVEVVEAPPTKSIAFGIERLGLIPMKAPIVSCVILVLLIIGAVFGIQDSVVYLGDDPVGMAEPLY